ncbi:M28 family peptidase [Pasteurella testudinis]|uniref:M28 family peptidase n=1 Tax=Pasteurella testudinis TaxID=761 RepID=UPI004059D2EB
MSKLPSSTIPTICTYRRGHGGEGERLFINEFLLPTLAEVTTAPVTVDGYGNILVDAGRADVLFVAHVDTVHLPEEPPKQVVELNDYTLSLVSKNATCLGADDGAGIAVLLYLLSRGVEGQYLFTRCEERGGIGASYFYDNSKAVLNAAKIAIEIDRRGYTDVIYSQGVGDCASLEFATSLADRLGQKMKPSDLGSFTDIATFADIIPECVNLSAGYFNEHTPKETVNLEYVDLLARALELVVWETLPITREAGDFGNYGQYDYYNINRQFSDCDTLTYRQVEDLVKTDPQLVVDILIQLGVTAHDVNTVSEDLYGVSYDDLYNYY